MTAQPLELLKEFPARLARQLSAVPETGLDYSPPSWDGAPSEALTIRQQVCHLSDIETDGYRVRFSRVLAERHPLLPSIDTQTLIGERRYDETPVAAALAAFAEARAENVRLLATVDRADFGRTAVFQGYGEVTLRGLVRFLISHDQQHLAGVHWLLGKFESLN